MKTTRLMIPAAVALSMGLSSCVNYWEARRQVKENEKGPEYRIDDSYGRNYDRYGIPPESDNVSSQDVAGHRPGAQARNRDVPVAQLSDVPDEVISPYPPHRRINVAGFASGALAKDPKSGEIFRLP